MPKGRGRLRFLAKPPSDARHEDNPAPNADSLFPEQTPPAFRPVPKTFWLNRIEDYPPFTARQMAERLHGPEALCHKDLSIGGKGLACYGDNAETVLFLKEKDRFGRFDRTEETPAVIG